MNKILNLTFCFLLSYNAVQAQSKIDTAVSKKRLTQIEIMPYIRWDNYPKFTYAINSITTNDVYIKGLSYGINAIYGKNLNENLKLKTGIGYYRYSFTKIRNINSSYGEGDGRVIDYPYLDVIYSTNKYWYHTISLSLGAEKYYAIKDNFSLLFGVSVQYYHTFAQFYKIFDKYDYKRSQSHGLGFAGTLHSGIAHKFNRTTIVPQLIIPIYDAWRKDAVFPGDVPDIKEDPSSWRDKWFNGFGIGCAIQYEPRK